ncbi:hypothetical protein K458DRAFT_423361 [Lentithecium fluviatile CBS 122367]|uniref:Uncharacterized protein n=1 Tax=Lentithecium fluviatile CBS 122367 TaxID=1168545 RepID=A0A6G1IIV5_9PLEO|nr:hypothetical protein K458DRAFT_423361 [Lentithecium fluviatile CBS 122367]
MGDGTTSMSDVAGVVGLVIGVPAAVVAVMMLAYWIKQRRQIRSGKLMTVGLTARIGALLDELTKLSANENQVIAQHHSIFNETLQRPMIIASVFYWEFQISLFILLGGTQGVFSLRLEGLTDRDGDCMENHVMAGNASGRALPPNDLGSLVEDEQRVWRGVGRQGREYLTVW